MKKHLLILALIPAFCLSSCLTGLLDLSPGVTHDPATVFDTAPYRTGQADPKALFLPEALSLKAFSSPGPGLQQVVKALLEGVDDQVRQARILHDWIALNIAYDAQAFSTGRIPDQSPAGVLTGRKAVCEGYSMLFLEMCSLARIKCVSVSGYGRGCGCDPLVPEVALPRNHAWNAVFLLGNWYLVDVTWDAGYVSAERGGLVFNKRYSTAYFLLDPGFMAYSHLPMQPMWQLLDPPLSDDAFRELPHLEGEFFDYAMPGPGMASLLKVDDSATVTLGLRPGMFVFPMLLDKDGKEVDGSSFMEKKGDACVLRLLFPKPGAYTLAFFGGKTGGTSYTSIGKLGFMARKGSPLRYPEQTLGGMGTEIRIISPADGRLRRGRETKFIFELPSATAAALGCGDDFLRMDRSPEGYFTLSMTPKRKGEPIVLMIATGADDRSYEVILSYAVVE